MANPTLFCTHCLDRKPHAYALDTDGDIRFTCQECNSFIPVAKGTSPEGIREFFDRLEHNNMNNVHAHIAEEDTASAHADMHASVKEAFGLD